MILLEEAVCRQSLACLHEYLNLICSHLLFPRIDNHFNPTSSPPPIVSTMESAASPPEITEAVLFRPAKKRKIYRQRAFDDGPHSTSPPLGPIETIDPIPGPVMLQNASPADGELESTHNSMSEILRLRKLRKHRVNGVEFRDCIMKAREEDGQDGTLVLQESSKIAERGSELPQGVGVARRFARQTGMVGDVDKHM